MRRIDRGGGVAAVGVAVLYGAVCWWRMPEGPFTAPDSVAYLEMQPLVPLGYPVFLRSVGATGAMLLQPALFAAALGFLGVQMLAASGSALVALLVVLAISVTPDLADYHYSILTESLFMSGQVAFLASIVRFARAPSWDRAAQAALIAGVTTTVRRTGYALLPVLVVMVVMHWRKLPRPRAAVLGAAVLPMLMVLGVERLAAGMIHRDTLTSLTGRHLFAKAALIDSSAPAAAGAGDQRDRLHHALQATYAPIRHLIAEAPPSSRASLTLFYETCLQGPCVGALRDSLAPLSEAQKDDLLREAAVARIASAPSAFAQLTARHYGSLWTAYKLRHPERADELEQYVASHRPLPFERETFKVNPDEAIRFPAAASVRVLQPLVVAVGWFTAGVAVFGIVCAARGVPPVLVAAGSLAALTAHSGLLLTAAAAAGISRFTISMFPAVVTALCVGVWLVVTTARDRWSSA